MKSQLPITVCMLCLDEEKHLAQTLDHVKDFAQWIVLDTGSSDRSIQIAKEAGAQVIERPFEGFSETRKKHFALADQEWILWLDADEELTQDFIDELKDLFKDGNPAHKAYKMNRIMFFENKWIRHGEWFPDQVTRLFHRDHWSMAYSLVHESVSIDGSVGSLQTPVPHFSYSSWEDRTDRIQRYAVLWAQQHHQQGRYCSFHTPFLRASWRAFRSIVLKAGFLDGLLGIQIGISNGFETYLKYVHLRRLIILDAKREYADIS